MARPPTTLADDESRASGIAPVGATDARRALVVSLVTLFVAMLLCELGFRASTIGHRLAVENIYTVKANAYSHSAGYEVAIIGDSRIMHGVDPRVVEHALQELLGRPVSVWNAGLSGAPPMAHLAWVERILSHPNPPRLVVLSISPNQFSTLLADPPARESLTAMYRLRDVPDALLAGAPVEDLATITTVNLLSTVRYRARVLDLLLRGQGLRGEVNSGIQGFGPLGAVTADVQDARARHRLIGYQWEMDRRVASFGNEQMGYFLLCLKRLHDAHIRTIVMNSPAASQLDPALGPMSFYRQHIAFVQREARAYGDQYVDALHSPVLTDGDFTDGDHMSSPAAARFSDWLARTYLARAL